MGPEEMAGDMTDEDDDSTYSMTSSIMHFNYENGRRYHAYHEGRYIMPNDEHEQDKLLIAHYINEIALDGKLFLAPLERVPENVLDIGTGRAEWAIDFAEYIYHTCKECDDLNRADHEDAKTVPFYEGTWHGSEPDPTAMEVRVDQSRVPENLKFEIDDAEDDWLYTDPFDLIHTRTLCGGIRDWPRFHKQAYKHLKPGGWIELQENEAWFQGEGGTYPKDGWTPHFLRLLDEASIMAGARLNVAAEQKQHLIDCGFVDVQDVAIPLPLSEWHDDPKMKHIGRLRGRAMNEGVEGYSLALFSRVLGWTKAELQILLANVRREFNDPANRMYIVE
ncbi:MAG: hypothetical protein M1819_001560 [Sarea resinae]|nr:MAG: hypothetical protein M1819_001560 [Sarea resinae]